MKINQLFKEKVPEDTVIRLLTCFGLKSMDDPSQFSRFDLNRINTVSRVSELADELRLYYLPCKGKVYLDIKDEYDCITILRQIIRLYDKAVGSFQKYVQFKKTTYYYLKDEENTEVKQIKFTHGNVTVDFS